MNLMEDAKTMGRWFLVVTMGRSSGHLALGIGKSASATLTVIPEEFEGDTICLKHVIDIMSGAIIKRQERSQSIDNFKTQLFRKAFIMNLQCLVLNLKQRKIEK